MIVPVQAIYRRDEIVKVSHANDGTPTCLRFHPRCFRHTDSQRLARLVSSERTDEILKGILAKETALQAHSMTPLSFHSFDAHAHGSASCRAHACTDARKPCGRCFSAQLARFAIAHCQP
jgi:hypothetical protein